jgi:hypothetical protein
LLSKPSSLQIYAETILDAQSSRGPGCHKQRPDTLATNERQINFALAIAEQSALPLTAHERDLLAACESADANHIASDEMEDAIVVRLRPRSRGV